MGEENEGPAPTGTHYICAHCGSFAYDDLADMLDNGTTLHCVSCGMETVVELACTCRKGMDAVVMDYLAWAPESFPDATPESCVARLRNLEKAGALIAAEIDRLALRTQKEPNS